MKQVSWLVLVTYFKRLQMSNSPKRSQLWFHIYANMWLIPKVFLVLTFMFCQKMRFSQENHAIYLTSSKCYNFLCFFVILNFFKYESTKTFKNLTSHTRGSALYHSNFLAMVCQEKISHSCDFFDSHTFVNMMLMLTIITRQILLRLFFLV